MNEVDSLLRTPFRNMSLVDKKLVKSLGPHQPKDIKIIQQMHKCCRKFNTSLFDSTEWLTASEEKRALFCHYCMLFAKKGETVWTQTGYTDINHLQKALATHAASKEHKLNAVSYKTFGTVDDVLAQLDSLVLANRSKKNKQVAANRNNLTKIADAIAWCGTHEIALRGHDETQDSLNRGIFLDLLSRDARSDSELSKHLEDSTVAKYTSATSQNELLDSMYEVYRDQLLDEVKNSPFLSIQADEATDITNTSQLVVILHLLKGNFLD